MGGSPSKARKLTVDNDNPMNVIEMSDDVVQRIRGSQNTRHGQDVPSAGGTPVVQVAAPPMFMYEPSLTSMQLRQSHSVELKKNDDYWKDRLRKLESQQKKINDIMDQECKKALLHYATESKKPVSTIPCEETKNAVMQCYLRHPKETMQCAKVVQAFQECVNLKRASIIASKG